MVKPNDGSVPPHQEANWKKKKEANWRQKASLYSFYSESLDHYLSCTKIRAGAKSILRGFLKVSFKPKPRRMGSWKGPPTVHEMTGDRWPRPPVCGCSEPPTWVRPWKHGGEPCASRRHWLTRCALGLALGSLTPNIAQICGFKEEARFRLATSPGFNSCLKFVSAYCCCCCCCC